MAYHRVHSELIESVFFSPADGQLYLRFRNGECRLFGGVTEQHVDALVAAPSPGRYYMENIRNRFERLAA